MVLVRLPQILARLPQQLLLLAQHRLLLAEASLSQGEAQTVVTTGTLIRREISEHDHYREAQDKVVSLLTYEDYC